LVFFLKKSNQTVFFKIKKSKPIQTNRFWFSYFGKKPVQTSLARFLDLARFDLVFFRIGSVFPVWVVFDFFSFRLIKSKSN